MQHFSMIIIFSYNFLSEVNIQILFCDTIFLLLKVMIFCFHTNSKIFKVDLVTVCIVCTDQSVSIFGFISVLWGLFDV